MLSCTGGDLSLRADVVSTYTVSTRVAPKQEACLRIFPDTVSVKCDSALPCTASLRIADTSRPLSLLKQVLATWRPFPTGGTHCTVFHGGSPLYFRLCLVRGAGFAQHSYRGCPR